MSEKKISKARFRHRGFKCLVCEAITHVYGMGIEPSHCEACGKSILTKEWDKVITTTKVSQDYQGEEL